jgi:hypothetical protein
MKLIAQLEKKIIKQNKVYIVPSKDGIIYLLINFTLFLIGLTYANNFTLLICFILFIFFLFIMFDTHQIIEEIDNLNFIYSEGSSENSTFKFHELPQLVQISIFLNTKEHILKRITNSAHSLFKFTHAKRGIYKNNRFKIYTYGKFNFFYVWTYKPIKNDVIIYPKQKPNDESEIYYRNNNAFQGSEEFNFHQLYTVGMNSKRIDWKVYARQNQLYSKMYEENQPDGHIIDYSLLSGTREERISKMAYLVEMSFKNNIPFALKIDEQSLPLAQGEAHFILANHILAGVEYGN